MIAIGIAPRVANPLLFVLVPFFAPQNQQWELSLQKLVALYAPNHGIGFLRIVPP